MDLVQAEGTQTELTEVQLRVARLIAMGMGYKEVAGELSIDRTTLYRCRKTPTFSDEVSRLMESAREETRQRVVRDISEINDIVLSTLLDVAQNDSSGSARVQAARTLGEMVQRAEERANNADDDVMRDRSGEIRAILEHIRQEKLPSSPMVKRQTSTPADPNCD